MLAAVLTLSAAVAALADIQNDPLPPAFGEGGSISGAAPGAEDVSSDTPYIPGQSSGLSPGVPVPGPDPTGAVTAMLAIPPQYIDGIVLVTATNGRPAPDKWIVVARDGNDLGTLHKLTVEAGQVISNALSFNAYESFRQNVSINPQAVQVDSPTAFLIAERYAAANQKIIGHADYALTVRGSDSVPIWTVNCFGTDGFFLGKVVLLATTGNVISHSGFRLAPE